MPPQVRAPNPIPATVRDFESARELARLMVGDKPLGVSSEGEHSVPISPELNAALRVSLGSEFTPNVSLYMIRAGRLKPLSDLLRSIATELDSGMAP